MRIRRCSLLEVRPRMAASAACSSPAIISHQLHQLLHLQQFVSLFSLPAQVVHASSVNDFKNKLDVHWSNQEMIYTCNYRVEISGTGSIGVFFNKLYKFNSTFLSSRWGIEAHARALNFHFVALRR